jgi:hypothetical protein
VSSISVEPGTVLDARYRVDERLDLPSPPACFAGTDTSSQEPILLVEVAAEAGALLGRAAGVRHLYISRLLAVVEAPGGGRLAVSERVTGETLTERMQQGPKPAVDAVRSALRVADALSNWHDAGAVHGAVSPDNVVVMPDGREAPVLRFGHPGADAQSFWSPGREAGGAASEADDAWAVAGLLHLMLTGKPPPREGYESEDALLTAGVADAALRVALSHALNKDAEQRGKDLRPLNRELARWFVEHAGEEPIAPGPHSSSPPPLPSSQTPITMSPATSSPRARPAPKKGSRIAVLATGGIVLGLAGGWVFNSLRSKERVEVVEVAPQPAATPENKAIDLGDVPVTGESETIGGDKLTSCVTGYLPKDSFGKPPDFGWVCDEVDPRTGADKLRVAVVSAAPKGGAPTEAMKIFARIGWYDMAAYAVVRAGCCLDAKPLKLPEPSPSCSDMAEALQDIGKEVAAVRSPEEALKKYTAAIHCELNAARGATFRRNQRPAGGEDSAFLELIKAIQ